MSLVTNVTNLATRVATEVKALRTLINGNAADLSSLNTTSKTSLVSAVNEVNTVVSNKPSINDSTTSSSSVWSSSKTNTAITSAVAAVVDAAPAALDTLNELAAALGDDANYASTITTALSGKAATVHTHAISDVTGLQTALDGKASTTDVGDTTTNFVTTFEAGLV
jgi:hypothetical protein